MIILKTLSMASLLLLAFSPFADSQTLVEDPQNLLTQVDQFVGPALPFSQEFVCGQVATFDHYVDSCTFTVSTSGFFTGPEQSCTDEAKVAIHTVSQCTSDQISIFSDDAENTTYSNADYTSYHGDLVRQFMANLSTYISASGKIVLSGVTSDSFTLVPGQAGSPTYSAMELSGKFILDGYQDGPTVMFTILKDVPGVAQIARFRIGDESWFRLKTLGASP